MLWSEYQFKIYLQKVNFINQSIFLHLGLLKMQELKQTALQFPQLTCARLNKAVMCCASSKCQSSALSCMKEDCQVCKTTHRRCLVYDMSSLIEQVVCKKQTITPQIKKAIQALEKIYDNVIEKLSFEKELISAKVQLFGLNDHEIEFVRKIQNGLANEIQGKLVMKVLSNLNVRKQFQASDQSINRFWNKKKNIIDQLFDKLKLVTYKKPNYLESQIVDKMQQVSCFFKQPIINAQLLYRASENGFAVDKFHQVCDGVTDTVTLFKTEYGYIGGGYTNLAWSTNGNYGKDTSGKSFIFSVTNKQKYKLVNSEYTIYCGSGYGPTFGGGHDIYITNQADSNRSSYFNVPHSYNVDNTLPENDHSSQESDLEYQQERALEQNEKKKKSRIAITKGVLNPRNFIGSQSDYYSRIVEWEVFKLQF